MTRTLHRLFKGAVAALSAAIIALAVLSIIARLLLPQADGLRDTLVARLTETLGVEVEVGTLSVQLRGLTPTLSFADAKLLAPTDASPDPGQPLLAAQTLRVDLNLLATLKALRPRIDAISLVGAELQVLRDEDGTIRLLGLDSMQGNDARALDFFLREGHFRLLDSRLTWRDLGSDAPARAVFIELAELANHGQQHDLRLQALAIDAPALDAAKRDGAKGAETNGDTSKDSATRDGATEGHRASKLELLAKLDGPPQHPDRWSGSLYLSADGDDLGAIAGGLLPAQLSLSSSSFWIESWNLLEQGRLTDILMRVGVKRLDLKNERQRDQVRLGDLAGLARWQRQAQGWQLDLGDLRLPSQSRSAPTKASLRYRRVPAPTREPAPSSPADSESVPKADLFATIGTLEIGPIAEALPLIIPDLPESMIALGQGRLHGLIRNLAVRLTLTAPADALPDPADKPSMAIERAQASASRTEQAGPEHRSRPQTELDWTAVAVGDWRLRASIDDLTVEPGNSVAGATATAIPPFSGLNLSIDLGPRGGYADVSGSDVQIDLEPLFAQPHAFIRVDGSFAWRLMPAGSIHLWTEALSANTKNLETLTRLSLCLHPSGVSPFINLHTHLRNGSIAALPRWLPVGIMDDGLEDWLLRAVVAGRVESGDLLLRGPLEQFPFDDQEGRFIMELRAVDGVLDYGMAAQPTGSTAGLRNAEPTRPLSWPPLQQVAATLRIENRSLEIDVPSAEILNSQINAGRVSMPNLWQPTYLEIDAQGEGPLADGIHVLATSPLAHQLGGLASAVEVSGNGGISLQLGVPLNKALPFRYAGELLWDPASENNADLEAQVGADHIGVNPDSDGGAEAGAEERTLSINGTELRFDQIIGRLRFDETGIEAEGLETHLGRQALEVDVTTLDSGTDDGRTLIDLRGRTAVNRLAETLPNGLWSLVSGALDWRLGLTLKNRDAAEQRPPINFALRSDLRGVGLAVPAPVGKSTNEPRELQLSGRFQDQWPFNVKLEYGSIGGLLEVDRQPSGAISLPRLAIDLNGEPTVLPSENAIQIGGALERLDLEPWLSWFATADLNNLQGGGGNAGFRLLPIQLQVEDLKVGTLQLNTVSAVLTSESTGAWDIRFSTKQTGDSRISLPATTGNREQPIQISLEQLDIEPIVAAQDGPKSESNNRSRADPRQFRSLDLKIEELRFGEDLLGQLHVQSQPVPNGVRFETLTLAGPHVDASGNGDWLIDATDYIESSLQLSAKSSAVGEFVRESGFYSALSGAPGALQLDLSWPGGPSELSLAQTRGSMEIEVGSGRMLDMEPGVGRMLGILNTGALTRRLSLDFSDVFDDGFSFDSMAGEISIGSGEATIRELSILAPPADIRITGRTNLVDGLLDQQVEVTPKIGVGLALAGAVAGGPVVGAAVYLADRVTDGAVERLGRYAYQVTGPWRDPVIRRVDTGGSPSVGNLFVDEVRAGGSAGTGAASTSSAGPQAKTKDPVPSRPAEPTNPFLEGF